MADEWYDPVSAAIISASAKAGLTGRKAAEAAGWAVLASNHNRLKSMPVEDARKRFAKLDISLQDSLKNFAPDAEYTQPEPGLFGKAWDTVVKAKDLVIDGLSNYEQAVSSPYRAARQATSFTDFASKVSLFGNDFWKNGERQFDPEREQIVDSAYDPNVAKIAKRISIGDKTGDIAADMETPEEIAAYEKFIRGDQDAMNAIRDYNDAKVSIGRDWARTIGLEPNVGETDQGLEGKMYKLVSGTADTVAGIVTDPAVLIGATYNAVHQARYGVMSMLAAEAGSLTRAQKMLTAASKVKGLLGARGAAVAFGIEAAMNLPKVRDAFQKIGPMLEKVGSSKATVAEKAMAMDEIRVAMPNMTDRAIIYMAQNGVKDVDTAKIFFRDSELAEDIMMGRVGSMQATLPVYTVSNKFRSATRKFVNSVVIGEGKQVEKFAGKEDTLLNELMSEGSIVEKFNIKQTKMSRDRFARMTDRALLRNYVNVEGDGVIDSAADIYSLARTFLGRPQARLVSNAFAIAPDAASRRQIVIGLYSNLGEYLGVKSTEAGAKAWNAALDNIKNAKYSNDLTVDARTARAIGVKSGTYDPSMINGRSVATSVNQATERMALPQLQDLLKLGEKNMAVRAVSVTANNAFIQRVTDYWSALNLLPRLGLRSVLDETLFHSLTLPVMLFPTLVKGYTAGITQRIVRGAGKRTKIDFKDKFGERDIGIVARTFSKFFADVDEATMRAALSSRQAQADLIQEQITKSRFGRLMKFSKNFEADAKYISDLNRYALTRNLDDFSAGATAGIVNSLPTERIFDDYSDYANLNIDAAMDDLGKRFGEDLREISFTEPEFAVNMLMQLAFRVDGNGEIGRIAVRYMDRPKKAVLEIKKYLQTPEGKAVYDRFDRSRLPGRSIDMDAKDFYLNVRGMFVDDAGELNTALLGKVRKTDAKGREIISTTDLTVDDLGEAAVAKMLPRRTLGYAFRVPKPSNYVNDLIDRGFQIADRQLGTLSRTPVYNAYYLGYRRQFGKFEERYYNKLMQTNGMTEKAARAMAARRYAELADNMAINRAIGFVDNPNVRSFAAYNVRNLARYYRATEDFWRRAARVGANSPQALVRLRLASETLDHAGFIHEDENGDKYFMFPTDTIMYGLTALPTRLITGEWPKQPMPLSMTGKIKMLTPSLDMESNIPSFSGPLAAVGFAAFAAAMGFIPKGDVVSDYLDTKILGQYAENQKLIDAIQPMLIRRGLNIFAVLNEDEKNAQYISAAMKGAAYYSANPEYKVPDATSNFTEIQQFKNDVRATGFNLVLLRNLVGIFAPVSPQLTEGKDVPEWMRDAGVKSFKREFTDILNREYEKGTENAAEVAIQKYTRLYPGKLAYTVPESELTTVGAIKNAKRAVDWIQKNNNLVNMFPQGSVFLMPQMNEYDIDAYMFLKREGYGRQSKELETYLNQIATVKAENEYYDIKNDAEKAAASTVSYNRSRAIMAEADAKASAFLKDRPYLQLQMVDGGRATTLKRMALDDARNMLASPEAPNTSTANLLRKMIETYDSAAASIDNVTAQTDEAVSYRRTLRASASEELRLMAGTNPNAMEFYDTILKRLIEK